MRVWPKSAVAVGSDPSQRNQHPPSPPEAPDFRALYRENFSYVWNTLVRLGARVEELQDIAQDVFTVVFRKLGDYDPARPVKPWLFGIAFRVLLDQRRKLQYRNEQVGEAEDAREASRVSALNPEADVQLREARDLALVILRKMDIEKRAVFVMYELEGHTMPEIAEVLGVPLNTAYSRLRLARMEFNAAAEAHLRPEVRP